MTDTNPRPLLANAHEAAEEYLTRKVVAGDMALEVADGLATAGFLAATRTLSALRKDGVGADKITAAFERQRARGYADQDTHRIVAAEFTLAVWDGMQRDLAEYLSNAG